MDVLFSNMIRKLDVDARSQVNEDKNLIRTRKIDFLEFWKKNLSTQLIDVHQEKSKSIRGKFTTYEQLQGGKR